MLPFIGKNDIGDRMFGRLGQFRSENSYLCVSDVASKGGLLRPLQ